MKEEQNYVIEEGIVDNIKMDNVTSFTTNIPVYQIFEIESDDEEVDEKPLPRSALTYGDLKLISNNRMLTDTIINAAQNIIHLQHPSIAGLQDTLLGQSFHSKDAKDQQIFRFKELPDQPSVQVLYDGNIHWLAICPINCLPAYLVKFSLWIVFLGEKLTIMYNGKYVRSHIPVWTLLRLRYCHWNNKKMILIVACMP